MKQAILDLSVIERLMESSEPLTEDQQEWVIFAINRAKKKLRESQDTE